MSQVATIYFFKKTISIKIRNHENVIFHREFQNPCVSTSLKLEFWKILF